MTELTRSDGGRRKRLVGRALLALLAAGGVGYAARNVAPVWRRASAPAVVVRNQPAHPMPRRAVGRRIRRRAAGLAARQTVRQGRRRPARVRPDGSPESLARHPGPEAAAALAVGSRSGRLTGASTRQRVRSYPAAPFGDSDAPRDFLQFEARIGGRASDSTAPTWICPPRSWTARPTATGVTSEFVVRIVPKAASARRPVVRAVSDDQNLAGYRTPNCQCQPGPDVSPGRAGREIARLHSRTSNLIRVVINGESWAASEYQVFIGLHRDWFDGTKGAR
jgi:hypothetical protein